MLFMTGFVSGAVSAFFVGALADRYGRRAACLVFCILYSLSCATVLVNNLLLLFVGRALGGISATLLYSVFETWMVSEYHQRGLEKAGMDLSAMFGDMTTFSSIVAIIAGVVSQFLVAMTMTDQTPFMASIVCLVIATALITQSWVSVRVARRRAKLTFLAARELRQTFGRRLVRSSKGWVDNAVVRYVPS